MTLTLLKGVNVMFNESGNLCLEQPQFHGCAVFAPPSNERFQMRLTALRDDRWIHKAGSYCIGIMQVSDIHKIDHSAFNDSGDYVGPGHVCWARAMAADIPFLFALSTGSFRFSHTLFDEDGERIFAGSLVCNRSVFMRLDKGSLGYKLEEYGDFTDVTSKVDFSLDRTKGKGKGKFGGHGKGKGKGAQAIDNASSYYPNRGMVPFVWLFSDFDSEVQVHLGLGSRPCSDLRKKTLNTMWDDRCFTDCVVECMGECFQVHRAVLCSASPIFKSAFVGTMQEARQARFAVRDCEEPLAVAAMLEFTYKGSLPDLNVDVLRALLPLAIQYELDELSGCVADILLESVALDTVREITKVLRQFRDHRIVAEQYSCLMWMLRANESLLTEALV